MEGLRTSTPIQRPQTPVEDEFFSFPALADPEEERSQTLAKLFTKTLKRVTNNASHIVNSYSSPRSVNSNDFDQIDSLSNASTPIKPPILLTNAGRMDDMSSGTSMKSGVKKGRVQDKSRQLQDALELVDTNSDILSSSMKDMGLPIQAPSPEPLGMGGMGSSLGGVMGSSLGGVMSSGSGTISNEEEDTRDSDIGLGKTDDHFGKNGSDGYVSDSLGDLKQLQSQTQPQTQPQTQSQPQVPTVQPQLQPHQTQLKLQTQLQTQSQPQLQPQLHQRTHSQALSQNQPDSQSQSQPQVPTAQPQPQPLQQSQTQPSLGTHSDDAPKVTSDRKTLRFTTTSVPVLETATGSVTSSVMNVNALASTDQEVVSQSNVPTPSKDSNNPSRTVSKKNSIKALQNRISSIFTNLPNDIELSDDSASDTETIQEGSTNSSPHHLSYNHLNHLNHAGSIPPPELAMYSDSVVKSSPVKVEQSRHVRPQDDSASQYSSFNALKQINMKKKSSNLSSSLIDNARSIINNNFHGSMSSASSIKDTDRKKKKKTKRVSENPLKSGGIPRKYWMNDAFVSECLNCFKPFTAFRRKHHCRFCGQIFCSQCTLFISYQEHKEQRKTGVINPDRKHFKDKLRVCKPCHSDVIVYLSDSDSSSSEDEIEEDAISFETMDKFNTEDSLPQHPFVRSRSRSVSTTRREPLIESNKSFLKPSLHDSASDRNTTTSTLTSAILENPSAKQKHGLSIPTTRKGETVEIPVSKSVYSNNSFLNANIHGQYGSGNRGGASYESSGGWLKNYPHLRRNQSSFVSNVSRSGSHDNLSAIAGFGNSLAKMRSHTDNDSIRRSRSGKLDDTFDTSSVKDVTGGSDEDEDDDEFESEAEDEQVMSLYTSLNHGGITNPVNASTISPRAPIARPLATVSANSVPTLGEFPTMMVNEKLYPKNMSSSIRTSPGGTVFPRFIPSNGKTEEVIADTLFSRGLIDDNPKASLRSHERAHASLLRMRSRRRAKTTAKNVQILTQSAIPQSGKVPPLEYPDYRESMSPISTPTSPTPGGGPSGNYFKDGDSSIPLPPGDAFSPSESLQPRHQISFGGLSGDRNSESPIKGLSSQNSRSGLFEETGRRIDTVYLDSLKKVLLQCLEDCDLRDDVKKWDAALTSCISFVNGLHLTDTLDIKQYVKIKKIAGGRIEDTAVVEGILLTKNIDSKKMSTDFNNPKIALLMFPIEYLKQKEQFISLRIVQSQQDVYISNLVSRLISMEPDVVVVGDTVCQLAKDFMEEAGITVVSNTKPQVIERISRYTKADIFQSVNDLFFKKGSLGTCKKFEVKRYVHNNIVKTFIAFTGTDSELGFTIALRGGDEEVLNSIKYTTENLLAFQINAKFEKSFFEDRFLVYSDDKPSSSVSSLSHRLLSIKEEVQSQELELEAFPSDKEVFDYIDLFVSRQVSTSPASKFSFPTPLSNAVEAFINYYTFLKKYKFLKACESLDDVEVGVIEELKLSTIDAKILPNSSDDLLSFLKYTSDIKLKSMLYLFQSRSRSWTNYLKLPSYQLYPIFHKNIHLLYSNVSMKFSTPCSGPNIIVVDFYTDNDKFLGLQLDQMFSESLTDCEECGESMMSHYRNYVHGNGKLDMSVEKYETLPPDHLHFTNQRTLWSVCKKCNYKTPVIPMSDDTYYFSIGKFFEIAFWGENVAFNGRCECPHDFFRDHTSYFGFNDMAIKVEYSAIDSYEVVVPQKQTEYDTSIEITLKVETLDSIRTKSTKFFNSISKRLNRVKVDTFDKAEDGSQRIEELKEKLDNQQCSISDELLKIYNSTLPTSYLPLNSILRKLQELGVSWDYDFNDFETKFLPSENDITRITQFHLRNFLMDSYNTDDIKEVEMNDMSSSKEDARSQKSQESEDFSDDEKSKETKFVDNLNEKPKQEISKLIPRALNNPLSNVGDKVSKMEKFIESERKQNTASKPGSISGLTGQGDFVDNGLYSPTSTSFGQGESSKDGKDKDGKDKDKEKDGKDIRSSLNGSPVKKAGRLLSQKPSEASLQSNQSVTAFNLNKSKVSQLATFFDQLSFDQISLEFKKQREQELRKNLNKFRALPIVASKPIVEIYNKIEDVVDADEMDIDRRRLRRRQTTDSLAGLQMPKPDASAPKPIKEEEKKDKKPEEKEKDKDKEKKKDKILDIPQPERVSLLKTLTNFWADRSASLWDPLDYPLDSTEHTFADSDIIVREDEPSSLVAFCLSTNDYKQKIKSLGQDPDVDTKFDANEVNNKKINSFAKIEKKFKNRFDNGRKPTDIERIMTKNKSTHLKYQFTDGTTSLSCKIFYSEQFEALRRSCGKEDRFIQSLSRCIKWNSSGGKSGSNFLKTLDNRYIVKELSKAELESFVSIAPFYFKYISQSMFNTLTTALAKIFGFYQISVKNSITGKTFKMDFLIMENLFYNTKTTRIFDLKGSMRNRHVTQTGKEDEVLLDENMIEYIYESPLFVKEHSKKLLRGSLFNDTSFLSAMDVMDYSLIIGINDQTRKLHIGIIDWLRTFTWDKKVENWVKGNNLIGGNKKGKDPTIVTPKQYRIRFREAMERYILEVPDVWYESK